MNSNSQMLIRYNASQQIIPFETIVYFALKFTAGFSPSGGFASYSTYRLHHEWRRLGDTVFCK